MFHELPKSVSRIPRSFLLFTEQKQNFLIFLIAKLTSVCLDKLELKYFWPSVSWAEMIRFGVP